MADFVPPPPRRVLRQRREPPPRREERVVWKSLRLLLRRLVPSHIFWWRVFRHPATSTRAFRSPWWASRVRFAAYNRLRTKHAVATRTTRGPGSRCRTRAEMVPVVVATTDTTMGMPNVPGACVPSASRSPWATANHGCVHGRFRNSNFLSTISGPSRGAAPCANALSASPCVSPADPSTSSTIRPPSRLSARAASRRSTAQPPRFGSRPRHGTGGCRRASRRARG